MEYNVYCDESCHLENDNINVMVLGAVYCPKNKLAKINEEIKQIKNKHNLKSHTEIKWNKISPNKLQLYLDIIDFFFDNDELRFRCLVIPDKKLLNHEAFSQTHNEWYYKMYFSMLSVIFEPNEHKYNVYLDIKDTNSYRNTNKLHDICCHSNYDFSKEIIEKIQSVRSFECQIIQLTDILIGALAYKNRGLNTSSAKTSIVNKIIERSGYSLTKSTLLKEPKFNCFFWNAQKKDCIC